MSEPHRAADLLGGILRQAGVNPQRQRVARAVDEALGPDRADRVEIRGFRNGHLVLEVESSPLLAELRSFDAEGLRQRINERLDNAAVAKISFRLGAAGHT